MVPESSSNGTVDLYRASRFPYQWEFVRHLIEHTALIDATLLFHEHRWWLFANVSNHAFTSTNDQLFLYYAVSLLSGEWVAHPKNPVATHIGNCRPAGRIFR